MRTPHLLVPHLTALASAVGVYALLLPIQGGTPAVISREVSFGAGIAGPRDILSREVSFGAGIAGPGDVLSREVSFGAGIAGPGDIVSREVSFGAPQPAGDLAFDIPGVQVPTTGSVDQPFEVRWRVQNRGLLPVIGTWRDEVRFSQVIRLQDGTPGTSFASVLTGSLVSGATYERTLMFLMPSNATTFTVTLVTDATQVIEETNDANNTLGPLPVTVVAPNLADLRIAVLPPQPQGGDPGDIVSLSFRVWNAGTAATSVPSWVDQIYIGAGTNPQPVGLTPLLALSNPTFLQPAASGSDTTPGAFYAREGVQVTLPEVQAGPYFLAVRTNDTGSQPEVTTENNWAFSASFQIGEAARPDLYIQGVGIAGVAPNGAAILNSLLRPTVVWNVGNRGQAPFAGNVPAEIWLSRTGNIAGPDPLAGDVLIATTSTFLQIPVGETRPAQREVFLPPDLQVLLPGPNSLYFVKVFVDPDNAIPEIESLGVPPVWNNLGSQGTYDIQPAATPDLDPDSVAPLATGLPPQIGHPLQLRWRVRNLQGLGWPEARTWGDRVWLSSNASLDAQDTLLGGTYWESAVPPGQPGGIWEIRSYEKSISVPLPPGTTPGSYHLLLETDVANAVYEASGGGEGNNFLPGPAFEVLSLPADLALATGIGGGPGVVPSQASPGQAITLAWTVTNASSTGTTSASSWEDRVWLSTSPSVLENAVPLATRSHQGQLGPGSSYVQSVTTTVPNLAAGNRWLHFRTDPQRAVFEDPGALGNNVRVEPFDVGGVLSDLGVDAVTAVTTMRAGDVVAARYTVRNAGVATSNASNWIDTLYLSAISNPPIESPGIPLGSWPRSQALGVGASYQVTVSFPIPYGVTPGNWYLVARADSDNRVFELNESNNDRPALSSITIEPPATGGGGGGGGGPTGQGWLPANLVTRNVRALTNPITAGQIVEIEYELSNEGLGATSIAAWSDRVAISSDAVLGLGDATVGYFAHSALLAPGESRTFTAAASIPLWANGTWTVFVDADAQGAVIQNGVTADDIAAGSIPLVVTSPPLRDLDVVSLEADHLDGDSHVLLGEALAFRWTTRNDATDEIPSSWGWSDAVYLIPAGATYPSLSMRYLGSRFSSAGTIPAGQTHMQAFEGGDPAFDVPAVAPGPYRLVVAVDALNQIAELDESDNFAYSGTFQIAAIPLASGGEAQATLANGASRWFRLTAPPNQTIDLFFEHDEPAARCELYVREGEPPSLGVFDLASEGLLAPAPNQQTIRLPRTSGADYYVLARAVAGVGQVQTSRIRAVAQPFAISEVEPRGLGRGTVTARIRGSELWKATGVELRAPGRNSQSAGEIRLDGDVLLARFDLVNAELGDWTPVILDGPGNTEAAWAEVVAIEPAVPLTLRAEVQAPPSIRRGEMGIGVVQVVNAGNVDVPFAALLVGRAHAAGTTGTADRVGIRCPDLPGEPVSDLDFRDAVVAWIEDLGPGMTEPVRIAYDIGPQYADPEAAVGVTVRPFRGADFVGQALAALSAELRLACAADPSTPALVSVVAQDPVAWDATVNAALASGNIDLDSDTLHSSSSPTRGAGTIVDALAAGIAAQLGLPAGVVLPLGARQAAGLVAPCTVLAGTDLDCGAIAPPGCGGGGSVGAVLTSEDTSVPVAVVCTATPGPVDPNVKVPSPGVTPAQIVSANRPLEYVVHFENESSATGWASRVLLTDPLEPGFRSSSVRFQELRIGRTVLTFPPNTPAYLGLIDLDVSSPFDVRCQVSAVVNASNDTIQVLLQALDGATGLPNSSGSFGLLPPAAAPRAVESTGYLKFTVLPELVPPTGLLPTPSPSGAVRRNSTRIQLNTEPPLTTNTTQNMLDGGNPTSALVVAGLDGSNIHLRWRAGDVEVLEDGTFPGTGISGHTLSSAPSLTGPWTVVLASTSATEAWIPGAFGTTTAFKIEAADRTGNAESKVLGDLVVTLPADCNGNGIGDDADIATGGFPDDNQNGVPDACECLVASTCDSTPDAGGVRARITAAGTPSISHGGLTLSVTDAAPNSRGLFFFGPGTQQVPLSDGFLCVTGPIVRLTPLMTEASGAAGIVLNLPALVSSGVIASGDTRYFQFWYRNIHVPGGSGVDLSDALRVTFCE